MEYIKIRLGNVLEQKMRRSGDTEDTMFHHTFNPMFSFSERLWKPHMDIFETPEDIIILAEIAGVDSRNIEIEVCDRAVRISGKRAESPPVPNATYRLAEIQNGSFERILKLPRAIDTERVTAEYANGFLKIHLKKTNHPQSV